MLIRHFFTPGLAINTYLIFDEETKKGAVIDPTRQIGPILSKVKEEGVEITDIMETHVHADFVSGAPDLKAALGGKPRIHCSGMGGADWVPRYADRVVKDREEVALGGVRLQAWHTPGHTPEHVMWVAFDDRRSPSAPEVAFTGDALFVGSVGRPDLLGKEAEKALARQLYSTLFQVIHPMPDFVEVFPAHGAGSLCGKEIGKRTTSTIGYEKRTNPGLAPQPYDRWLNSLEAEMPTAPRYFRRMKQVNVAGAPRTGVIGPIDRSAAQAKGALFVDIRKPGEFALGSFKGAVNLPLAPAIALWAGAVLPYDKPLVIVGGSLEGIRQAIDNLQLVGFDEIIGWIELGALKEEEKKSWLMPQRVIAPAKLHAEQDDFYILDVRTQREWDSAHIDGAHLIELTKIVEMVQNIPLDKQIAVVCHSGNRASLAATLLSSLSGLDTYNVEGGMQAWINAHLPTVT